MNTLLCAGGAAVKVLEAMLHLCAAGLGPKQCRVLLIDPDDANATTARVKLLVSKYQACHDRFVGKLGAGVDFFRTKLDLLERSDRPGLQTWSPLDQSCRTLSGLVNYDNLDRNRQDLTRLFFTQEEMDMGLGVGFKGHTTIGAAAMTLISQPQHAESHPWDTLIKSIQGDMSLPTGANVFLAASVFGGTGASSIYPIARFLDSHEDLQTQKLDKLRVGVGAIVPYFRFAPREEEVADDLAAKSELFHLRTRAAVEFYNYLRQNEDWPFHSLYWMGDNAMIEYTYGEGGPEQENEAHFVDFLMALAAVQFFEHPGNRGGCYYCGPEQAKEPELGSQNLLEWSDIPLRVPSPEMYSGVWPYKRDAIRYQLLRFLTAGIVHKGFFRELMQRSQLRQHPCCVPWFYERFAANEDWFPVDEPDNLKLLTEFYDYHFPFWSQIHKHMGVRLFNRAAFTGDENTIRIRLDQLRNLLWSRPSGEANSDAIDEFFTYVCDIDRRQGGDRGMAGYLALLTLAADQYIRQYYNLRSTSDEVSHG